MVCMADNLILDKFEEKYLNEFWNLWHLIADFGILAHLSAAWDAVELSRGDVRLPGSFYPAEESEKQKTSENLNLLSI